MLVYVFRFLYLPVGVRERLRDEFHERQVIFMCFAALICQQCLAISKCRCTGFSDLPRTFPLFLSRDRQARVGSLLQTGEFLPGKSILLNLQRKYFLHEKDLIDILAPPAYIHESGNRAAKPR